VSTSTTATPPAVIGVATTEVLAPSSSLAPETPGPASTSTTSTTTTTTTSLPDLDVHDPDCVVGAATSGALEVVLAGSAEGTITGLDLWLENDLLRGGVTAGDLVDVCVGNQVDDLTGAARTAPDDLVLAAALVDDVRRQQVKLNELFTGFAIAPLEVDGVSGPRTRQRLCAARLALGLPTSTADMLPGTSEYLNLFATDALPTPATTAIESERWILIDLTCQVMFAGDGRDTLYVFPTSTGTEGFETRGQDRTEAFRFNPAFDNGGWHDSTEYPVGVDNPLNGNMYKPLYFDLGQAIHGANSVPASPASKGCARLQVGHQNLLLGWLGLGDATASIWRADEIEVTVNVQGEYVAG